MSIHELQAALRALDEAQASGDQRAIYEAASTVVVWARRVAEGAGELCQWTADDDGIHDYWNTGCGLSFSFNDGGPEDNGVRFCHGCGKPVTAATTDIAKHKENTNGR